MSFPYTFAKRSGDYDFISPLINFIGNSAIVAGACTCASLVTYCAFKALGFSTAASAMATAIPAVTAVVSGGAAVCAAGIIAYIAYAMFSGFLSHY